MSEKSIFSENLKKARKMKGWKQWQAANMLYKSLRTYQAYEEGRAEADIGTLVIIFEVFEIDNPKEFLSNQNYFTKKLT